MHREAQVVGRHHRGRVQDHAQSWIAQQGVEIVVGLAAIALHRDVGGDAQRRAEQLQRLIQQMRREIIPETGAGPAALAPAVAYLQAEAVEMTLELRHLAQCPGCDELLQRQEVAVVPTIVEHRQHPSSARRMLDHCVRLGDGHGEGFVHDHMLAGVQRGVGLRGMQHVRRRDHDQLYRRVGEHHTQVRRHARLGIVCMHRHGIAGHHAVQRETMHGADQRRVKQLAHESIPNQCDLQCLGHVIRAFR